MDITAIEHTDVRGNKLYYLKVTNKNGKEHLINVGEKTCNSIKTLIADDEINSKKEVKKNG